MASKDQIQLNDKRVIQGWTFFDWANSAFALVITVAIFPIYFANITDETVNIFGIEMPNGSLFAYSLSIAYLIIAFFSPLLSGIADYGGKKKFFLKFFTYLGVVSCLVLFFFDGMGTLYLGTIAFIFGLIGFAGGFVFYNSYLPEIATEDQYDIISARGFSMGFIGSMILLGLNLIVINNPTWFGFDVNSTLPVRLSFLSVAAWWFGFSMIPFKRLPDDPKGMPQQDLLNKGAQELRKVMKSLKHQFNTKAFLISFFFYSAGVQTVLYLASTFAEKELAFETSQLILIILLLQVVGIFGALSFAKLSDKKGNRFSLFVILIIWLGICVFGYFLSNQTQFYIIAAAVGVAMGGTQSLSRATYAKIIPKGTNDITSYFSFYDVLEKVSTVLGTFIFGIVTQITNSMRISLLVLAIFFIVGIVVLSFVKIQHAKEQMIS